MVAGTETFIESEEISQIAQRYGVYTPVHPEDFIFGYIKNNPPRNLTEAAELYFHVGSDSATRLVSLIEKFQPMQPQGKISVFEFASGYGSVSRHLKLQDRLDVVPCDIHEKAVNFIRAGIGLPALGSSSQPAEFDPGRCFDVVFALSFFTHMPRVTWTVWFKKLFSLVKTGGTFIFTTHGFKPWREIGSPATSEEGFWFSANNDQDDLPTEEYGITISLPHFVFNQIRQIPHAELVFYQPDCWGGHQDTFVVRSVFSGNYQIPIAGVDQRVGDDSRARGLERMAQQEKADRAGPVIKEIVPQKDDQAPLLEPTIAQKDVQAHLLEHALAQKNLENRRFQSAITVARRQNTDLEERAQRLEQDVQKLAEENNVLREAIRQNSEDQIRRLAGLTRVDYVGDLPSKLRGLRRLIPWRRRKLRELARNYRLIAASPLFDAAWYLSANKDVATKREDPVLHYLFNGAREERAPSPIFDTREYLRANPDVQSSGVNPLVHYLLCGRSEGRHPKKPDSSMPMAEAIHTPSILECQDNVADSGERRSAPDDGGDGSGPTQVSLNGFLGGYELWELPEFVELRRSEPRGVIAVVVHVYHADLWPEICVALGNIEEPFDLFVTLVLGAADTLGEKIHLAWPFAHILVVDNRGRDVLPFVALLRTGVLFRYELLCKLHTKRSKWHEDGNSWRKQLIEGILGNRSQVRSILLSFRKDLDLALVVADGHLYSGRFLWTQNEVHLQRLFAHFGMDDREFDKSFAGGNMFWIRPALLRPICHLGLGAQDFEPEPLGQDGSLAHALERLFSLLCYEAGMSIKETSTLLQAPE